MQLTGLIPLFESMKIQNIQRYKFQFKRSNVTFDIIFFTDESPYILLFGARGHNFSFQVPVKPGFFIDENLSTNDYYALIKVLGIKRNDNNKFRPRFFFDDFNENIPTSADPRNIPQPHEIAIYQRTIEEADKIYFCGWRDNTIDGRQVKDENLAKTKKLLGYETYSICKARNISSKWTDNANLVQTVTKP